MINNECIVMMASLSGHIDDCLEKLTQDELAEVLMLGHVIGELNSFEPELVVFSGAADGVIKGTQKLRDLRKEITEQLPKIIMDDKTVSEWYKLVEYCSNEMLDITKEIRKNLVIVGTFELGQINELVKKACREKGLV